MQSYAIEHSDFEGLKDASIGKIVPLMVKALKASKEYKPMKYDSQQVKRGQNEIVVDFCLGNRVQFRAKFVPPPPTR